MDRMEPITPLMPTDNVTYVPLELPADEILPNDLTTSLKVTFIILYAIIIISAILGNSTLIFIVVNNRSMRTVTNMFLVSLAFSDILIAIWNMPFQLMFYVNNEWLLSEFMCKFTRYLQGVNVVSSTLALMGIAFDRYYAICKPIKARHIHTVQRTIILLIIFWFTSFCLLIPQIFLQKLLPKIKIDLSQYPGISIAFVCVEIFENRSLMIAYTFFFYIALYLLPFVIMLGTYGMIIHRLWIRQPIGDALANPRHHDHQQRQKKKIIKTLVTVVLLFTLCWFPFFTAQIYILFNEMTELFRNLVAIFQLIGYLNSCLNPIMYAFMNDTFRKHICFNISRKCRRKRRKQNNASVTLESGV